jgi:hypothetical protein
MEFIYKQSKLFNNLVYNYFSKKYNPIYKSKNVFILHNKNINSHYKIKLDEQEQEHTLIYVLYKNIYYKEISVQKEIHYKSYLDTNTKIKILKIYDYYKNKINLSKDVLIIGKRYINRKTNEKINDSIKLYCTFDVNEKLKEIKEDSLQIKEEIKEEIKEDSLQIKEENNKRRLFLYNFKNAFKSKDTIYIKNFIENGLFLDVEYTNDIYDDFTLFPVSKDNSMLFMIGMTFINKNQLDYIHYTTDKLTQEYEYNILKKFLDFINEKYKKDKSPVIIYHWSHADKTYLEKAFKKYPDLYHIYTIYPIEYVDLLYIVKKTIVLPSYSLKYIAKTLLNIDYDTECKNGLDAMCSIIQKNNNMNNNDKLTDFDVTKDVIQYNKMDTLLLYKVIMYFLKTQYEKIEKN